MNCIIIDDNLIALKFTEQCVSKVVHLKLLNSFLKPLLALPFIEKNKVDLIFLDVEMPEMNGLEFIKSLKDPKPLIVLTTTHKDYALDAFENNVTDYVLKPIVLSRFFKAVAKAKDAFEKQTILDVDAGTIFIKKGSAIITFIKSDVLWLEGLGDYVVINTKKEKFTINSTMKAMEEKFSSKEFMRVHRSFIIRIDKIEKIEDDAIFYCNNSFPIGKTYRKEVFKQLNLL